MTERLRLLDLFSGIGGFSLGLERSGYFETVAFCEIEPFCQQVLAKHWPDVPLYEDVRTLDAETLRNDGLTIDAICGGYPCQPFSAAGKRDGANDDRHLWPEVSRLVSELRPSVCFFENVAGHITLGLDDVLSDLEGQGYAAQTFVIPACAVGAHHRRDRLWIVAHSTSQRRREAGADCQRSTERLASGGSVSDAECERSQGQGWTGNAFGPQAHGEGQANWPDHDGARQLKPRLGRGFDGVSTWLDGSWEAGIPRVTTQKDNRANRLKALGNAVVPQIPEILGRVWGEAMKAQQ